MEPTISTHEADLPERRIEESILTIFGYGDMLDVLIKSPTTGDDVKARNFLDAYGDSPHRQETEDLLNGFMGLDPSDPDYKASHQYILTFLEAQLGPPTVAVEAKS